MITYDSIKEREGDRSQKTPGTKQKSRNSLSGIRPTPQDGEEIVLFFYSDSIAKTVLQDVIFAIQICH